MTRSFRSLGVHSAQRVAVFHGFKFPNFRNPTWNEEKINRINTQGKKVNLLNRFPFETSTKFQEWKQTNIIILKWPAFPSLRSGVVWSKTIRGCHHGLLTAPAPSQPARPPTLSHWAFATHLHEAARAPPHLSVMELYFPKYIDAPGLIIRQQSSTNHNRNKVLNKPEQGFLRLHEKRKQMKCIGNWVYGWL